MESLIHAGAREDQVKTPELEYTPGAFPVSPVNSLDPPLNSHNSLESPIDPDSFYRSYDNSSHSQIPQALSGAHIKYPPTTSTAGQQRALHSSNTPSSLPKPIASSGPYNFRANLRSTTNPVAGSTPTGGAVKPRSSSSSSSTNNTDGRGIPTTSVAGRARQFEQISPKPAAALPVRIARKSISSQESGVQARARTISVSSNESRADGDIITKKNSTLMTAAPINSPTGKRRAVGKSTPVDTTDGAAAQLTPSRQPLFGEVITVTDGAAGHGIPANYAKRSASESNMQSPTTSPQSTRSRSRVDTQLPKASTRYSNSTEQLSSSREGFKSSLPQPVTPQGAPSSKRYVRSPDGATSTHTVKAVIKEIPDKSPPPPSLRSSRPRVPLSAASTASSRAKQSGRVSARSSRSSSPTMAEVFSTSPRERKMSSSRPTRNTTEGRQRPTSRSRKPNYATTDSESSMELRQLDGAGDDDNRSTRPRVEIKTKRNTNQGESASTDIETDESPILGRTVYQPIGQRHDRIEPPTAPAPAPTPAPAREPEPLPYLTASRLSPIEASPDPNELAHAVFDDVSPGAEQPPTPFEPPAEVIDALSYGGNEGTIRVQLRGTPVLDATAWPAAPSSSAMPDEGGMRDSGIGDTEPNDDAATPTKRVAMAAKTPSAYQPYDTPPEKDFQPGVAKIHMGPEVPPKDTPVEQSPQLPQIQGIGKGLGLLDASDLPAPSTQLSHLAHLPPHYPPPPIPLPPLPASASSMKDVTQYQTHNLGGGNRDRERPSGPLVGGGRSTTLDDPTTPQNDDAAHSSRDSERQAVTGSAGGLTTPADTTTTNTSFSADSNSSANPISSADLTSTDARSSANFKGEEAEGQGIVLLQISEEERAEEMKRTTKVRHIIAELLNTEAIWREDILLVRMIYMEGAKNILHLDTADIQILFGNWLALEDLCERFKKPLRESTSKIYYKKLVGGEALPRDWEQITLEERLHREALCTVGATFLEWAVELAQVYGKYIFNQPASAKLYDQLEQAGGETWTNYHEENRKAHKDKSTAWDLPAFLVKPLQRLTKYPLLLKSLRDVMPVTHPDYADLNEAIKKLEDEIIKINTRKARLELLEKVKSGEVFKKNEEKKKVGFSFSNLPGMKLFKRQDKFSKEKYIGKRKKTDKELAKELRILAKAEDVVYQKITQRFGAHFFQVQIVVADISQYAIDVKKFAEWFMNLSLSLSALAEGSLVSEHTEIVSKWMLLAETASTFATDGAEELAGELNTRILGPLHELWALHKGPHNLMMERKKHLAIYIKYLDTLEHMKDDAKLTMPPEYEAGKERFVALNETLKEELPKLYELTNKAMSTIATTFMLLSTAWHCLWLDRFAPVLGLRGMKDLEELGRHVYGEVIQRSFREDFAASSGDVQDLAICNGSLRQNLTNYMSPMPEDGSSSYARPSTTASRSEINLSSPNASRRHSGQLPATVPRLLAPTIGQPPDTTSAALAGLRSRGNSQGTTLAPTASSTRPSTATQQSRPPSDDFRAHGSTRRMFDSAVPMDLATEPRSSNDEHDEDGEVHDVMFIAASLFEFSIDQSRLEAGYPYLAYQPGEIFNVFAVKGELWLARNQDDGEGALGWIWERHFARILDA